MLSDAHVLSDVHTDCQYQVIAESNLAVTRFKIYFPFYKDPSEKPFELKEVNVGKEVKDKDTTDIGAITEVDIRNSPHRKAGEDGQFKIEQETKTELDEDGDLVLNRNHFQMINDYSVELSSRKKIKLDEHNVTSKVVEEIQVEKKCFDNVNEYTDNVNLNEVNTNDQVLNVACQCSERNYDSGRDFVSDAPAERNLSNIIEICKNCGTQRPKNKVEQNCVNVTDLNKGTSMIEAQNQGCVSGTSNSSVHNQEDSEGVTERNKHHAFKKTNQRSRKSDVFYVNIKHCLATDLDDVGQQVWHGALLLSDYIIGIHGNFDNRTIVDLGAGVGLSSIVAAMYANTVYCTDTGEKILSLAEDNVQAAATCPTLPRPLCDVHVKQLDWFTGMEEDECKHGLTMDDINRIYGCEVLIAADVIYDFDITDAFFNVVRQIMTHPPSKTLYIGLEKRLVFTVEDLTVTSPGYNYFRLHLEDLCSDEENDKEVIFKVEQIDTRFQQFFQYNRIKQLELWKITASPSLNS